VNPDGVGEDQIAVPAGNDVPDKTVTVAFAVTLPTVAVRVAVPVETAVSVGELLESIVAMEV